MEEGLALKKLQEIHDFLESQPVTFISRIVVDNSIKEPIELPDFIEIDKGPLFTRSKSNRRSITLFMNEIDLGKLFNLTDSADKHMLNLYGIPVIRRKD